MCYNASQKYGTLCNTDNTLENSHYLLYWLSAAAALITPWNSLKVRNPMVLVLGSRSSDAPGAPGEWKREDPTRFGYPQEKERLG